MQQVDSLSEEFVDESWNSGKHYTEYVIVLKVIL